MTWEAKRDEILSTILATCGRPGPPDPLVLRLLLDEVYLFAESAVLRPKK